jgi:hypothetical protein
MDFSGTISQRATAAASLPEKAEFLSSPRSAFHRITVPGRFSQSTHFPPGRMFVRPDFRPLFLKNCVIMVHSKTKQCCMHE